MKWNHPLAISDINKMFFMDPDLLLGVAGLSVRHAIAGVIGTLRERAESTV